MIRRLLFWLSGKALAAAEIAAGAVIVLQFFLGTIGDLFVGLFLMAVIFGVVRLDRWAREK